MLSTPLKIDTTSLPLSEHAPLSPSKGPSKSPTSPSKAHNIYDDPAVAWAVEPTPLPPVMHKNASVVSMGSDGYSDSGFGGSDRDSLSPELRPLVGDGIGVEVLATKELEGAEVVEFTPIPIPVPGGTVMPEHKGGVWRKRRSVDGGVDAERHREIEEQKIVDYEEQNQEQEQEFPVPLPQPAMSYGPIYPAPNGLGYDDPYGHYPQAQDQGQMPAGFFAPAGVPELYAHAYELGLQPCGPPIIDPNGYIMGIPVMGPMGPGFLPPPAPVQAPFVPPPGFVPAMAPQGYPPAPMQAPLPYAPGTGLYNGAGGFVSELQEGDLKLAFQTQRVGITIKDPTDGRLVAQF